MGKHVDPAVRAVVVARLHDRLTVAFEPAWSERRGSPCRGRVGGGPAHGVALAGHRALDEFGAGCGPGCRGSAAAVDRLAFLGSTGLRALVELHQLAPGRVHIAGSTRTTRRLFELTGLDRLVCLHPDAAEAVTALSGTAD
jgi:hypothetical protein